MSSLTGAFLVAGHSLRDPTFRQTVILVLRADAEGAFGLVVNRQATAEGLPFPVFIGGPCESQGLFMLHGHAEWLGPSDDRTEKEVAPGVFLGDSSCIGRVGEKPSEQPFRFRVFNGYAGWGPGQLEGELAVGAWEVVAGEGEVLFATPVTDLWRCLVSPAIPRPSVN